MQVTMPIDDEKPLLARHSTGHHKRSKLPQSREPCGCIYPTMARPTLAIEADPETGEPEPLDEHDED